MRRRQINFRSGQSLIEVIVALGIIVVLATGIIAGTTTSLKISQFSSAKSDAIKYAQEGVELSRKLRDSGWIAFQVYGNASGKIWCLSKTGSWTDAAGTIVTCSNNIDGTFTRSVTFQWTSPQMKVTVVVSWTDSAGTHSSQLVTYLTNWR